MLRSVSEQTDNRPKKERIVTALLGKNSTP
jgi:hypothetical protein